MSTPKPEQVVVKATGKATGKQLKKQEFAISDTTAAVRGVA